MEQLSFWQATLSLLLLCERRGKSGKQRR